MARCYYERLFFESSNDLNTTGLVALSGEKKHILKLRHPLEVSDSPKVTAVKRRIKCEIQVDSAEDEENLEKKRCKLELVKNQLNTSCNRESSDSEDQESERQENKLPTIKVAEDNVNQTDVSPLVEVVEDTALVQDIVQVEKDIENQEIKIPRVKILGDVVNQENERPKLQVDENQKNKEPEKNKPVAFSTAIKRNFKKRTLAAIENMDSTKKIEVIK